MTEPPPDHARASAIAARTSGCTRFKASASVRASGVPRGEPPTVPYLSGQCGAGRDVEHDPTSLVGTPVCDRACGEVSIHQVGEVPVEIRKTAGQVLPQAFEHFAHVLVKPRLDNLRGPLVFLLVSVPALRNLVPQCGNLARDLVERARPAVDAAEITLEFDR